MYAIRRAPWLALWALAVCAAGVALCVPQGAGVIAEKDVVYGEAGGQKLLIDVYRPEGPAKVRPAVLFVHGGGWVGGDKKDYGEMPAGLAKMGYVAFSVNYRLVTATGNKYPAQLDDVQRAVRWIRANAGKYGVDPSRVGALGASAGGHLVALLGTCDTRDNGDPALAKYSSRVSCVVDLFGPTDFTVVRSPAVSGAALGLVAGLFGKTQEQAPGVYRSASPAQLVTAKAAPFLIFHGTADPLVPLDQSQRMHDALRKAGIESTLTVFEGEGHGWQKPENTQKFIQQTVAFLNKHLKP